MDENEGSGGTVASTPKRPPNLAFMIGWLVFLGFYQIFLAARFGSFFTGDQGDLRQDYGADAMEPIYAALGIVVLVVAWGGWRLRPWAYTLAWVIQGFVFVVVIVGIVFWLLDKPSPIWWLLCDATFGVFNLYFLTRPATRAAFGRPVRTAT